MKNLLLSVISLRWLSRTYSVADAHEHIPENLPEHTGVPVEHQELWQAIDRFQMDKPGAELPFSKRLAKLFGWSHEFALETIEEYKKFMFLCIVCDHMVSPSVTVDEVWHLHLQYTKGYRFFCKQVLGRFIDHNPSDGGEEEASKFSNIYELTLNEYYRYFGMPPRRVWAPENMANVYCPKALKKGRKVKTVCEA